MQDLSCPKCGLKRDSGAVECPRCGIIFEKYEQIQKRKAQESIKSQEQAKSATPPNRKSRNKISETVYITVALALFGMALVVIVAIALNGRSIDFPLWAGGIFVAVSIPFTVYKRHFRSFKNNQDVDGTEIINTHTSTKAKPIGALLAVGIIFFPVIFSWFTLGKGYSARTRLTTFIWLGLSIVLLSRYNAENSSSLSHTPAPIFINQIVTLNEYKRIQNGMSYNTVKSIIGSGGEELSRSKIDGTPGVMESIETVMFQWVNGDGGNMNAMFQNDKLIQKAQFGLR